jgi:hypothetical protein
VVLAVAVLKVLAGHLVQAIKVMQAAHQLAQITPAVAAAVQEALVMVHLLQTLVMVVLELLYQSQVRLLHMLAAAVGHHFLVHKEQVVLAVAVQVFMILVLEQVQLI